MNSTSRKILLYSHDGCGLGHLRRQLTIAGAISASASGSSVLVAMGSDHAGAFTIPSGVELLKLPGLQKVSNGRYASRHLRIGDEETTRLRSGLLEAAIQHFQPDVFLVDKHPIGPNGELIAALEAQLGAGRASVLGVRDILDSPATVRAEWDSADLEAAFERYFTCALIYGTPGLLDPHLDAGIPEVVLSKAIWCGHVVAPIAVEDRLVDIPDTTRPVVLGCAGGGDDGVRLLLNFVDAVRDKPWHSIIVTGPLASAADREVVERAALSGGVEVHTFTQDLGRWFPHIDALVSMGGYNTLIEAASTSCPTVCVPRCEPRQEQLIRASVFDKHGLLRMVHPDDLNPEVLRDAITAALATPRAEISERVAHSLDLNGASRASTDLLNVVSREIRMEVPA